MSLFYDTQLVLFTNRMVNVDKRSSLAVLERGNLGCEVREKCDADRRR